MIKRITFILELEVDVPDNVDHNSLGELLRPNLKEHILDINKHWIYSIQQIEAVYLPRLLSERVTNG